VKTVAVGATRNQSRVAQLFHLSMITFIIGLSGDGEDAVSFHHLRVCMALLTDLRVELLSSLDDFRFLSF